MLGMSAWWMEVRRIALGFTSMLYSVDKYKLQPMGAKQPRVVWPKPDQANHQLLATCTCIGHGHCSSRTDTLPAHTIPPITACQLLDYPDTKTEQQVKV